MSRARDNPFSAARMLAIRYHPVETTWDQILQKLDALGGRAAVIGPMGTGKTTLLEDLAARFAARGQRVHWIGCEPDGPPRLALAGIAQGDAVLVDGADNLGRLRWWRIRRVCSRCRVATLVVTSHRPGFLPTLLECRTSPLLLEHILRQLLDGNPRDYGVNVEDCFARHRGNLRSALRELYDQHGGF